MVVGKVFGGVLALSLANLAVVQYSGSEPPPDLATRQAMADACQAAVPQHSRVRSRVTLGTVRLEPLGGGHYWITLAPEGLGMRPIACDLVRDQGEWRAESVTVIEW